MKRALSAVLLVGTLSLSACTPQAQQEGADNLQVVASTSIIGDVVRNIVGEHAEVTELMGAGVDPHSYEPGLRDTRDIAHADAVFTNGLLLEPQAVERTINAVAAPNTPVVALAEEAQRYGFSPIPLVEDVGLDAVWLGLRVDAAGALPPQAVVDLTLDGAEGPGEAYAFVLGTFGTPQLLFRSDDANASTTQLPVDAHTHVSWAFTKPGLYKLHFSAAVREAVNEPAEPLAQQEVQVAVGVDPATVAPGRQVIDSGHIDITAVVNDKKLVVRGDAQEQDEHSKVREANVEYDPAASVIEVPNNTLQPIPPQREFRFLGNPGEEAYLLPQAVLGRHIHGEYDPHIWHDVGAMQAAVKVIRDELSAIDPAHAEVYAANTQAYLAELEGADQTMRAAVADIAPQHRNLVTTHHGYSYLGAAYGLRIAGFVTPNPAVEPSPRDLLALRRTLENLDVPAVFLEPQLQGVSNELTETAAHMGVKVCPIWGDSLDPPGTGKAHTYIEMVKANAHSLRTCLGEHDE